MLDKRPVAVSMRNITKTFGDITANDGVTLDIYRGEILSLLGENGSGKTTLMNMLSGIYFPDGGEILINGEPVMISSPREAFDHGIGMIHHLPHAHAIGVCAVRDFAHSGVAYTAGGIVHHAAQCLIVVGVDHQPQVADGVLHLFALIKR